MIRDRERLKSAQRRTSAVLTVKHDERAQKAPARVAQSGELLFEFHVERTHSFWRVELRDHGEYGVEAQFLDPIDVRIARTFHQRLDPDRTPREMAIAWAEEERKAIEKGE